MHPWKKFKHIFGQYIFMSVVTVGDLLAVILLLVVSSLLFILELPYLNCIHETPIKIRLHWYAKLIYHLIDTQWIIPNYSQVLLIFFITSSFFSQTIYLFHLDYLKHISHDQVPKVLSLIINCGRRFTIIAIEPINIYSTRTHVPSS